jgi:cell shape-determining protein MreC
MVEPTALENALRTLVENYREQKTAIAQLSVRVEEQALAVSRLERENQQLRHTIDELNSDRFSVKRLKDERRELRRKVGMALERLDSLEQEVYRVFEQ